MKIYSLGFLVLGVFVVQIQAQFLRAAADDDGLLVGTAVRPAQLSEAAYAATLAREFNMVEAEDAMKWWVLRPDAATYNFRPGDEVVRFAQAHAMKVRGHCLVWGRYNPDWLTQGHFTTRQLSHLLHEHITRVMKHYAGPIFAWDVVNEALDENGNVRDSLWYNQPGIGFSEKGAAYIEQVFRWARKADPKALLFYNEAEGEGLNRKSDAIYALIKDFKQRGVPSTAWDCRCTYLCSMRTCPRSLRTSPGSRHSVCRFTSPSLTSHSRSIPTAMLARKTWPGKPMSIAASCALA